MSGYDQINTFMVDIWGRINKIEEQALAVGLEEDVSITEVHIIEKIGDMKTCRMGDVARSLGVTLATLTVACDKLVKKNLVRRRRDTSDRRVVNISLTPKGEVAYDFHKRFHRAMIGAVMENLTEQEVAVLGSGLQKLYQFFEQAKDGALLTKQMLKDEEENDNV